MTFYVMAPTFERAWTMREALMNNSLSEEEAFGKIVEPFRGFMMAQVRDKDLKLSRIWQGTISRRRIRQRGDQSAELRRGFEIGFLIALPFLVIDMIVSTLRCRWNDDVALRDRAAD